MIPATETTMALSSDDLAEIDRFHTAWCEENGVAKNDPQALEVASALIGWYSSDTNYRMTAKFDHAPALPESEQIKQLLIQMTS